MAAGRIIAYKTDTELRKKLGDFHIFISIYREIGQMFNHR